MSTESEDNEDEAEIEAEVEAEVPLISQLVDFESSNLEYPIDLNIGRMTIKILDSLVWCNYQILPEILRITNSGKTVVLSAKWHEESPFVTGGPFLSRQLFSQIHFHWGPNDMGGSEHSVDGESLPMELHAVHFNSDYPSHEIATYKPDGISIIVYFFKLQSMENPKVNGVVKNLQFVKEPQTSLKIVPWPMSHLLRSFFDDYFLYRGSISRANYRHSVTWLISREPIGISMQQVAEFRTLKNINFKPAKYKPTLNEVKNDIVYHVNPSGSMYSSLLPISRSLLPPRSNNCSEEIGERGVKNEEANSS